MVIAVTGVYQNGAVPLSTALPLVPVEVPISVPVGSDFTIAMTVVDPTGAVVNVAGATFEIAVREFDFDAAPVLAKPGAIVVAANGTVNFVGVPADTQAVPFGPYRWAAWMKLAGARQQLVLTSPFVLEAPGVLPGEGPT